MVKTPNPTRAEFLQRKKAMLEKSIEVAEWWKERAIKGNAVIDSKNGPITVEAAQALIDEANEQLKPIIMELHVEDLLKKPSRRVSGSAATRIQRAG